MRILVTSDLHVESCGLEPIRRLVAGMDREHPDIVVIAGDIGNPLDLFEDCLACFLKLDCPIAVLAGNHDVWSGHGMTSEELWRGGLPQVTRALNFHWLEDKPLVLAGGVGLAGTIGWYDYSARARHLGQTDEELVAEKRRHAADDFRIDWGWDDRSFALKCRERARTHLEALERDPRVEQIVFATHVPVFEEQLERRDHDEHWSRGTAYFGHLTLGGEVVNFPKVRYVVSGHTHIGQNDVVEREDAPPIAVAVVASDYMRPRWVTIETP
ncbi:MAG: metallophosphoesterase [Candidatus Sumerlaeia bacterium]|nr:metallophosphoesterase [Candidatus Sumerlaeia bacterium]